MKRFCNILFVADAGTAYTTALNEAVELAENNQATLTVAGLVEATDREKTSSDERMRRLITSMTEQRQEELEAVLAEKYGHEHGIGVRVLVGKAFLETIREVQEHGRDLVIKSVEPAQGIAKLFTGTDLKLLRKCPCPVWLIKSTQKKGLRQVLAAVDHNPEEPGVDALNGQILEMAASLAVADFAELHVVHGWQLRHESFMRSPRGGYTKYQIDELLCVEEVERRQWLEALVKKHCLANGSGTDDILKPRLHLVKGPASRIVPELVDQLGAELVVMGTVGRTGIPGFFVGNTAENILGQIHCSVLTIKPEGFVSPVVFHDD